MGKKQNATDRRISAAYARAASGIQINIMDISRVYAVAEAAVKSGADDAGLEKAIGDFVQTIHQS
jgi:hypothetical protein